jgi:hypothetical protein
MPRLGRPVAPRLPLPEGSLAGSREQAAASDESEGHLPAFLPRAVLAEAAAQTAEHPGRETGGILIGHLRRDRDAGRLFLDVTAQIPARHTEASRARLTFTPSTWTDVQAALDLRRQDEIMVGWWHSHPVREWCKDCPSGKRADCALARGFFSEDDRLLHRTVFPRAYSIALVVNDLELGSTFSLFGWSGGLLVARPLALRPENAHAAD